MAMFVPVSKSRHQEDLCDFLHLGKLKLARMKLEWDVCRDIYQCISGKAPGGVDSSLVQAMVQSGGSEAEQNIPLDTTKLITMMLFLQSKLTLSEPSVVTKAYNSDEENHNAARFAQLVIEHIKNATSLRGVIEKDFNLNVSTIGEAVLFHGWNPDGGQRVLEKPENFDPLKDPFLMEGDYEFRSVSPYNFIIDPNSTDFHYDATNCAELRKIKLPQIIHEMQRRFKDDPERLQKTIEFLENYSKECQKMEFAGKPSFAGDGQVTRGQYVLLWEYWERAEPWNGLLGRYSLFADINEGDKANLLYTTDHPYDHKQLPFSILTDLDVAEDPHGMSRAVAAMAAADAMSQMYTQVLANIELHGSIRLLMPEGATSNEYMSDAPYLPIHFNPALGEKPVYLNPSSVTTDIWRLHTLLESEIDALYGANEFSRGEIPRELSSFAVSQAVERDDQFRIRLFSKKKEMVKRLYTQCLELTKQYVTESRAFKIAGDTNSYALEYFAGSDIKGKYGVFVDYGLYQPTDPHARKQQILELYKTGLYEKAGGNLQKLITTLVDGDMLDLRDLFENAKVIQKHEIQRLMSGEPAPVQGWHEHYSHYEEISRFMQTVQFERLQPETQNAIYSHAKEHEKEIAKLIAKSQPQQPAPGGGGGGLPAPASGPLQGPPAAPSQPPAGGGAPSAPNAAPAAPQGAKPLAS